MKIGKCSLGHIGIVKKTQRKNIRYPNGEIGFAYTGRHIWPLKFFMKPWSSKNPKWFGKK